jgi:hypothetical protein
MSLKNENKCLICGHQEDLKACSSCKMASYCSKDCQKKDFSDQHQDFCKLVRKSKQQIVEMTQNMEETYYLMDARLIKYIIIFTRVGTYVQRGSKFCFVVVLVLVADTLIKIPAV